MSGEGKVETREATGQGLSMSWVLKKTKEDISLGVKKGN